MPLFPTSINATPRRVPSLVEESRSTEAWNEVRRSGISTSASGQSEYHYFPSEQSSLSSRHTFAMTRDIPKSPNRGRRCSASSGKPACTASNSGKKAMGSGLLGFLALKEPSASAFEGYAKQQRKQAAKKSGKLTALVLPGVSSRRLPLHVPKVNSKWDGLPENVKQTKAAQREPGNDKPQAMLQSKARRSRSDDNHERSTNQQPEYVPIPRTRHAASSQAGIAMPHDFACSQRPVSTMPSEKRKSFLLSPSPLLLPLHNVEPLDESTPGFHLSECAMPPTAPSGSPLHVPYSEDPATRVRLPRHAPQNFQRLTHRRLDDSGHKTFWIHDSDDCLVDVEDMNKSQPLRDEGREHSSTCSSILSIYASTFYLDEDCHAVEDEQLQVPKYQPRTVSTYSACSDSTANSTASTSSAAKSSSAPTSDCTTPSSLATMSSGFSQHYRLSAPTRKETAQPYPAAI